MAEVLERGFKLILHIKQPEHLSSYDDLLSDSWRQSAEQVRIALEHCDCFAGNVMQRDVAKMEIQASQYVRCDYCGSEIDPAADEPCCELVETDYEELNVIAEDPEIGITPADVVRAALAKAAENE